jgi:hypothetical protein
MVVFTLDEIKSLIAGFCGAMVYSVVLRGPKSFFGALGQIFGGMACSYYVAPAVAAAWSIDGGFKNVLSFLVGLFGLAVAGGILWAIDKYDFSAWLPTKKGESK